MSPSFGQETSKESNSSLNEPIIRTGNGQGSQIQSESAHHSDRNSGKKPNPVRMRPSFGQETVKESKSSLNEPFIRTRTRQRSQIQSESAHHSDRNSGKKPNPVRISSSFGQEPGKEAKSSPNQPIIRTRTRQRSQNQSESAHHSDRNPARKATRVRMSPSFGQKFGQEANSSPNQLIIRTGTRQGSQIQSELGLHSDRNPSRKPNRV
jgi:hypothetical protein